MESIADHLDPMLTEEQCQHILELAAVYGILMRPSQNTYTHLPISFFPTPISKELFQKVKRAQIPMSKIMDRAARDTEWLYRQLETVAEIDEFVKRMIDISKKAHSGNFQNLALGILRSDYMIHQPTQNFQQVEVNTIASSFGAICSKLHQLHSLVLRQFRNNVKLDINLDNLQVNTALVNVCESMAQAYEIYGNKGIILFVVSNDEKNLFDQIILEQLLWDRWGIKVVRSNFTQIHQRGALDEQNNLRYDGEEVAIVYFRDGYVPSAYACEEHWNARELIECSNAVKCPNIDYQLAGCKKIQQVLTLREHLVRFCDNEQEADEVSEFFTGIYGFDDLLPDDILQQVLSNPQDYVIKPQREGGGNNFYDEKIVEMLQNYSTSVETQKSMKQYILMQKIKAPHRNNYLARAGNYQKCETVSEFGVFGTYISDGSNEYRNNNEGYLVRTKTADSNEGGVAAGFAVVDSLYLYQLDYFEKMDTQLIVQLLLKPMNQRSSRDIIQLVEQVSDIGFFKQLIAQHDSQKAVEQLCRVMMCSYYLANEYIFHVGDEADAFYIVLNGSVRVLVPLSNTKFESTPIDSEAENDEVMITQQARIMHGQSLIQEHPLQLLQASGFEITKHKKHDSQFIETQVYKQGDYFGEIGLLQKLPRQASIQCIQNSTLIVVLKDDYLRILKAQHEREINQKIDFLRKIPPFDQLTRNALTRLAYLFNSQYYYRKKKVFQQGDNPDYVYIIKQGQFEISQKFVKENQYEQLHFPKQLQPKKSKYVQNFSICIKTPQEMFGFDELMNSNNKENVRQNSCVCVSNYGELLAIRSDIFIKKVLRQYKQDIINQYKGIKDEWTQQRIHNLYETEELKKNILSFRAQSVEPQSNEVKPQTSKFSQKKHYISQCLEKMHQVSQQITEMRQKAKSDKKRIQNFHKGLNNKTFITNQNNSARSSKPISLNSSTHDMKKQLDQLNNKINKERKPPPNFLFKMRRSLEPTKEAKSQLNQSQIYFNNGSFTNRFKPNAKFKRTRHNLFR